MYFLSKPYWNYSNEFYAIEHSSVGNKEMCYGIKAKKKKGEFDIVQQYDETDTSFFEDLRKKACFLILTTSKILIKQVKSSDNEMKMINEAFPSINMEDFYYEILRSDQQSYIAICRREIVENLIKEYEEKKIAIIGFSLGFLSVQRDYLKNCVSRKYRGLQTPIFFV